MKLIFFHRRAEYNPCHSTRKPFSTMHVIVWEKPVGGVFVVGAAEIVFIFCQCPCNGKAGSVCSLQAEIGVVPSHPVYQFFYLVCTAHRFSQCQQCAVILFRILADNSCPTGNRQATVILHRFFIQISLCWNAHISVLVSGVNVVNLLDFTKDKITYIIDD